MGGRQGAVLTSSAKYFLIYALGEHYLCEKHQNKIRKEFIISSTTQAESIRI
jgi:hypothetical protein